MSISRQTYSRSDNIALFKKAVKELFRFSKEFVQKEKGENFIIRTKMMEMLAQQAFKYSITVSYLKDTEYSIVADKLDDVYLHLSRVSARNMASQYGSIATGEYDAMLDALDLIDERLKTVKVVVSKPRCRRVAKKSSLNPLATEWTPKTPLNPFANEFVPAHPIKQTHQFNQQFNMRLMKINELKSTEMEPETRLAKQCDHLRELFDFISDNGDFTNASYHTKIKKNEKSFVQLLVRKCSQIMQEIDESYDKLRCKKMRSNPTLRELKSKARESIKRTQKILSNLIRPTPTPTMASR